MKNVLCFGDSNTWGWNPVDEKRYERRARWTGIFQELLGSDYYIIEEGMNSRTTIYPDAVEDFRSGKYFLPGLLFSHKPLDLVILMLGTNDLKHRFPLSAYDIAYGAGTLVEIIQKSGAGREGAAPQVLLIAPPPIGPLTKMKDREGFKGGEEVSREFPEYYRHFADKFGVAFLDAGEIVVSSEIDGVHWAQSEHLKFAQVLAARTRDLLAG
ncbi:MAG: SGNH/GDSL hydrolase family protein [Anaerolineales bacterium]|nr:SGNH/GDSL hydrolase family protein [Anaerolineales bacterium]